MGERNPLDVLDEIIDFMYEVRTVNESKKH